LAVGCANNADYKDICLRIPCCGYNDDACDYPIQGTDCEAGPTGYVSSLEECDVYEYSELTDEFYSAAGPGLLRRSSSVLAALSLLLGYVLFAQM
jgi:hypothetical protein